MDQSDDHDKMVEEVWRVYLNTGQPPDYVPVVWYLRSTAHQLVRRLPGSPRCRLCYAPFSGPGGAFMRLTFGLGRSRLNPHICNVCEEFVHEFQGGAEVDVTVLFADVRGSTALARTMSPADFSRLINRFFQVASDVLYRHNGLVEKLIGDEVTAFFASGTAGPQHSCVALEAAQEILRATGHRRQEQPWAPVGIGVHTGTAYVGSVGHDIVVLGDVPNTGAHLASRAAAGEILASTDAVSHAAWDTSALQARSLELKGRDTPLQAWALTAT